MFIKTKLMPNTWKALVQTLTEFKADIRQLYMERCQLDDVYFPLFLDKLRYRPELQSITLSNISLGEKSSKALIHRAQSLQALALVNIKLHQTPIAEFLLDFGEEPTSLQRLALVEMNLNGSHLNLLKTIITINHKLDDLNLS